MTDAINVGGEGEPDPKPAVKRFIAYRAYSVPLHTLEVVRASDYDALEAERDALRARVAELEAARSVQGFQL